MASRMWNTTPEEAFQDPYNYPEQNALLNEGEKLLLAEQEVFNELNMRFHVDDRSLGKAIWLLHFDVLDALLDCIHLIREKRHNTASRLFRDVFETLDLAAHFSRRTPESEADLASWYDDKIIPHRHSRSSLGKQKGADVAKARTDEYSDLSRFTHRSYRVLMQSYALGASDLIWHDNLLRNHKADVPQIGAQHMALLAQLIIMFLQEVLRCGVVDKQKIDIALRSVFRGDSPGPNTPIGE